MREPGEGAGPGPRTFLLEWVALLLGWAALSLLLGCSGAPAGPRAETPTSCEEEWVHLPVVFAFNPGGVQPNRHPDAVPHAELAAEVVAAARSRGARRVRTEGHIDPCGDRGSEQANATARAEAIRALLVERGLPPERVVAAGYTDVSSRRDPDCYDADARGFVARVEVSVVVCAAPSSW